MTKKRQPASAPREQDEPQQRKREAAAVERDESDVEVKRESHAAPEGHEDEGRRHSPSPTTDEDVE